MVGSRRVRRRGRSSSRKRISRRIDPSTSPIGGIAIGRDQQRHVVVASRVGDAEAQRHRVEEGRLRHHHATAAEVGRERKSVVWGKSVSGRVTRGGRRILKKKHKDKK